MLHIGDALVNGILDVVLPKQPKSRDKCIYMKYPEYLYSEQSRFNLPTCDENNTRLIIVSDTHERHDIIGKLPACDVFIHCGDILMVNKHFSESATIRKLNQFNSWLANCPGDVRIVLGGNHDHHLELLGAAKVKQLLSNGTYVENESIKIGKLTVWGTPLSSGKSPNHAFQSHQFAAKTLASKPAEVDILLTHGLCENLTHSIKHSLHIWGHSHNSYGIRFPGDVISVHKKKHPVTSLSICAPLMDGRFNMSNLPIVIDIPKDPTKLKEIPTHDKIMQARALQVQNSMTKPLGMVTATSSGSLLQAQHIHSPWQNFRLHLHLGVPRIFRQTKVVPTNGSKYECD